MKLMTIKTNIIKWMRNIVCDSKANTSGYTAAGHCPNFATRCCLTCDKCWKDYHGTK